MANTEVLEPSQQLRSTVEHFLREAPTHANKRTVINAPSLVPIDTRVRPNGEVPMVTSVPLEFVAVATRDEAGHQVICWAFEGRLWVDDLDARNAGAGGLAKWLCACLGPRCFRVEATGERENNAVPIRAYFHAIK
jgi:hypothetical protein